MDGHNGERPNTLPTHYSFSTTGLKQSGYGKDMSLYALEDYTVARHIMVKH